MKRLRFWTLTVSDETVAAVKEWIETFPADFRPSLWGSDGIHFRRKWITVATYDEQMEVLFKLQFGDCGLLGPYE